MKIKLGYPSREDEEEIIRKHSFASPLEALTPALTEEQALFLREATGKVYLDEGSSPISSTTSRRRGAATRVGLALSPRSSLAMVRAAKAMALTEGRAYVLPDDVKALCIPVFGHRLALKKAETYKGKDAEGLLRRMMEEIPLPLKGEA